MNENDPLPKATKRPLMPSQGLAALGRLLAARIQEEEAPKPKKRPKRKKRPAATA